MAEWIATEWMRREDLEAMEAASPVISRMNSPFYEGERFAVRRGRSVLSKTGEWVFEPMPSSRDDAFYKQCRFDTFDEAKAALKAKDKTHGR